MQVGVFVDAGAFRLSDYPQIGQVGAVPLATPETGTVGGSGRSPMFQYKGSWTVTSRLLLDASYGSYHQDWNGRERPGNNRDLIRMTEQCTAGCPNNGGGVPGLVYRAQVWNADYMEPNRWQAAATYVTGAHNMKVGYQGVFHWNKTPRTATTTTSNTGSTTACRTSSRSSRGRTSRTRACDTTRSTRRTSGLAERFTVQGAHPLRPRLELLSRAADRPDPIPPGGARLSGVQRRDRLSRHQPADRPRLRRVRQREDRPEVQHGPVSRSRGQRQRKLLGVAAEQPRSDKRDAVVDRRQRQLHARLRSAER